MPRCPAFAGVILAAGESSRMGRDKALLPWPPLAVAPVAVGNEARARDTFLSAAIHSLADATDFVVVVVGRNEAELAPIVYACGADIVVNSDPAVGQFSSLQVGLPEVLKRGRDAAIVTLVDRPPAAQATVQALRDAFIAAPDHIWAVVPEFAGKHGHPYIAGRQMIEAFLQAPPTANARDIEHSCASHIQYVAVNDPCVAMNINSPEDYASLIPR